MFNTCIVSYVLLLLKSIFYLETLKNILELIPQVSRKWRLFVSRHSHSAYSQCTKNKSLVKFLCKREFVGCSSCYSLHVKRHLHDILLLSFYNVRWPLDHNKCAYAVLFTVLFLQIRQIVTIKLKSRGKRKRKRFQRQRKVGALKSLNEQCTLAKWGVQIWSAPFISRTVSCKEAVNGKIEAASTILRHFHKNNKIVQVGKKKSSTALLALL